MEIELKKELDVLRTDINEMIEKGVLDSEGRVDEKLLTAVNEWTEKTKEITDASELMQKQFDEMATAMEDYKEKAKKNIKVTPYEYFKESLKDNESFARYSKGDINSFNMQVKADILVSTLYSGNVIEQDRVAEAPFALPHEQRRVREIFSTGSTQSDVVTFVRQTARTAAAATVSEAGTKPQSDETLTLITEPIQVIAHVFDISNQALNDYNQMATYLATEGIAGLKDEEDEQILSGDGTPPNLDGVITQASTVFAGGTDISSDQDIDTLVKAYWQLRELNYLPSFILIPPAKMGDIQLLKETGGAYLYPNFAPVGLADWAINGAPLLVHNAMPSDTFLIGDGRKAMVWDREQANIRFSDSHSTNFATNMITIRMEERLAVAVTRPDAFISATFAAAQSTLT